MDQPTYLNLLIEKKQILELCKNLIKISLPEERLAIRDILLNGYCKYCGYPEIENQRCQCENEE